MIRSKNTSTPSSPRYYHRLLNGLMCARQASKHINIYIKILWDTILISSNHGTYKFSNHSCLQFINSTAVCIFSSNTYRLNDCLVFYAASVVFQSYNAVPLLQSSIVRLLAQTFAVMRLYRLRTSKKNNPLLKYG